MSISTNLFQASNCILLTLKFIAGSYMKLHYNVTIFTGYCLFVHTSGEVDSFSVYC